MVSNALHSSAKNSEDARDDWETPQWLFDYFDERFSFDFDAAANEHNTKCLDYYSLDEGVDSLAQPWEGSVWCNPPYSQSGKFLAKGFTESIRGALACMLVAARPDTIYWHQYCTQASEIIFIKGRLTFVGAKWSAPFPSAVIVFEPDRLQLPDGPKHIYMEQPEIMKPTKKRGKNISKNGIKSDTTLV